MLQASHRAITTAEAFMRISRERNIFNRGVFTTLSNIYDATFCKNSQRFHLFPKMFHNSEVVLQRRC